VRGMEMGHLDVCLSLEYRGIYASGMEDCFVRIWAKYKDALYP
jgi:hypothetical protein